MLVYRQTAGKFIRIRWMENKYQLTKGFIMLTEKYGEFTIEYCEYQKRFEAKLDGEMLYYSMDPETLRKKCDKHGEEKKKFIPIPVFKIENGKIINGKITSIGEFGVYVSYDDGNKGKVMSYRRPFKDTEENRELARQYVDLIITMNQFSKRADDIIKKIITF